MLNMSVQHETVSASQEKCVDNFCSSKVLFTIKTLGIHINKYRYTFILKTSLKCILLKRRLDKLSAILQSVLMVELGRY